MPGTCAVPFGDTLGSMSRYAASPHGAGQSVSVHADEREAALLHQLGEEVEHHVHAAVSGADADLGAVSLENPHLGLVLRFGRGADVTVEQSGGRRAQCRLGATR